MSAKYWLWILLMPGLLEGSTLTVGSFQQYSNLNFAIDQAQAGDTVLVSEGIYDCFNRVIDKPLTLISYEGAVLDGNGEGYILKVLADSVIVDGFKLVNAGRSYTKDYAAIYIFRSKYFQIRNCELVSPFFGILIEKSQQGVISTNYIHGLAQQEDDTGNGIHLWHCKRVDIIENEISRMRDGIYLEFVDSSEVSRNYAHHNIRYGLHFMFSNHDQYLENKFAYNGAGVAVMFSKFIVMRQNKFMYNWGTASYGLLLKEIYDAEVSRNLFGRNTIGIYIDGTSRIEYSANVFEGNGWGLKISGGCYANNFVSNDFLGNAFDVSYHSKMNDNTFNGNYWSSYSGYDLDTDGVGDIPYRPVKLFSYIVNQTPESIVLLRSLFIDILNFSEKVTPVFTPDNLIDNQPSMRPFQ